MEFLGSFWRARLASTALGDAKLIADFSINAVRRMQLSVNMDLIIEIPSNRLKVFTKPADEL